MSSEQESKKEKGRPKTFCRVAALEAAMGVFCQKGYEATSVAQLGAAMKMNPPSLYNAFGDKEGLFVEVLEHYNRPFTDWLRANFLAEPDTKKAIQLLFDHVKNLNTQKNALGCLIVNSAIHSGIKRSRISEKIKELHAEKEEIIFERLLEGQAAREIRADVNIRQLTCYLSGLMQGASAMARGQQNPQAVRDMLVFGFESVMSMIR